MNIESYARGSYRILNIEQEDESIQELFELKDIISEYLETGVRDIAVRFTNTSYIYSGEIRVLISCFKMVKNYGGTLCLIEPKESIYEMLKNLNIDKLIGIYSSEEDLPEKEDK